MGISFRWGVHRETQQREAAGFQFVRSGGPYETLAPPYIYDDSGRKIKDDTGSPVQADVPPLIGHMIFLGPEQPGPRLLILIG